MNCERCNAPLQDAGRYFPGSGYPVQVKREYQHVCVPCETQLMYGPLEERDAFVPPVAAVPAAQNRGAGESQSGGSREAA